MGDDLLQALLSYVLLQSGYLLSGNFNSLSEGEIIPLSGVSKSNAFFSKKNRQRRL